MNRLSISLLGAFRVVLDGEPVTDFATDKARALLAYLVVEADRPHRRDALVGLLWPDEPERKARQNLRQALSYLRQAIGDRDEAVPFLLISRQTIQFNRDSDHWLDVAKFRALVEDCERHRHRRLESCLPCVRRLEQMAALYREDFLKQFFLGDSRVFEEWASLRREWFHREMIHALRHLTNYYERRGDYKRAQRYGWRQIALEPWREEAHRQVMRLLALDGQRSAALAQYKACRQTLAEELGVEPTEETTRLYEQISASASGPIAQARIHRTSGLLQGGALPPSPTPFVGREEELAELAELLANPDCRMVTLVGPGGIGKTRLALQAAAEQIGTFAYGVAFVPLTSVNSSEVLVPAIADALGFSFHEQQDPEQQLLNYLREKELLLVLDGMEHVLEGAELVAQILRHGPGVIVLVTSRERLNLREEWVRAIKGLPYPTQGATNEKSSEAEAGRPLAEGAEISRGYSAIELFRQQARRVNHHFSPSARETLYMARICQLVEGLPLGVELAAARTRVRSCQEIAREIERNLDILSTDLLNVPERQRSIRATFEHSWQLLAQEERDLLAQLSVFCGGFRREAALQVTGTSLSTLLALIDKSLVRRVGTDRYDMHGLLTQYAADKLRESPQQREKTEMEHARYYTAFLEQQTEHLGRAKGKDDFGELALEIENARRAWQMAVAHDRASLVERSLESLYLFYDVQCRFQEGIQLFAGAIDQWNGDVRRQPILGKLLSRQGALYLQLCQYGRARTALERSQALFESLGITAGQIFCLVNLASVARRQGGYEEAMRLSTRSLALSRQTEDDWGVAHSLLQLGIVRYRKGDVNGAEALLEESLVIAQEGENPRLVIAHLNLLGDVACHRGDYAAGQSLFERCLALTRELGDQFKTALVLNNLGTVFHVREKVEDALSTYQESLDICREIGDRRGQAIALSNLGEVAYTLGAYHKALAYHQKALSIGRDIQDQRTTLACLNNLGETACAVENYTAAQAHLAEALDIAAQIQVVAMQLKILVNLAVLFARQGQKERAATLLGLACRHPASHRETQEKAERLLDELNIPLPHRAPESLEAVIAEVLTNAGP